MASLIEYGSIGHGIGLRTVHYQAFQDNRPPEDVDWVEVISENFLEVGGRPAEILRHVSRRMPVVLHGVSMNLGGVDPLDDSYLDALRKLAEQHDAAWLSDHLCWSSIDGQQLHDLLPVPYTEEALDHIAARVTRVQDHLKRPFALENPSSYVTFTSSSMTEWDFLTELHRRTGVGLLLDINNIYVSARNHGFSPEAYIDAMPRDAVWQFHLAGHTDLGDRVIDTHDAPVREEVWSLYRHAVRRFGRVATLIEWDAAIPSLDRVVDESRRARRIELEELPYAQSA